MGGFRLACAVVLLPALVGCGRGGEGAASDGAVGGAGGAVNAGGGGGSGGPGGAGTAVPDGGAVPDAGPAPQPAALVGACDVELPVVRTVAGVDGTLAGPGPYRPCGVLGGQRLRGFRFSADGRRLAGFGAGGRIVVLDAETLSTVATLARARGAYTTFALSPDASVIAAGAERDGELDVWRLGDHALLGAVDLGAVWSIEGGAMAVSPDGALVAASAGAKLVVLEVATGQTRTFAPPSSGLFSAVHFADGGRKLASERHVYSPIGSAISTIATLDLATGEFTTLQVHDDDFGSDAVSISADGGSVLAEGHGRWAVYDAASGAVRADRSTWIEAEARGLGIIDLSPDGSEVRTVVNKFGPGGQTWTWFQRRRVSDDAVLEEWPLALPSTSVAAWSPTSETVAMLAAAGDGRALVALYDARGNRVTRRACGERQVSWPISFAQDRSRLLAFDDLGGVHDAAIVDVTSGSPVEDHADPDATFQDRPVLSADGRWLAFGHSPPLSDDATLALVGLVDLGSDSHHLLSAVDPQVQRYGVQVFSTDSRLLAGHDFEGGVLTVFDVAQARVLASVVGLTDLNLLGLSADGRIARFSDEKVLRGVRWEDGATVEETATTGYARAASADASTVITDTGQLDGGGDYLMNVYREGALLSTFPAPADDSRCPATLFATVSPDGRVAALSASCSRPWYSATGPLTEIRDPATGALVQALPFEGSALTFSWDGALLAKGETLWCRDGGVR